MGSESVRTATSATAIKPSKRISKSKRAKLNRVATAKDPESIVGNGSFSKKSDF